VILGVISDTHGLLRPEAVAALRGVDLIIHAGDVGKEEVLETLRALAPLRAVRGNTDREAWAQKFPRRDVLELGGTTLYVHHGHEAPDPAIANCRVVVSGHSHVPRVEAQGGVLYLNPGSAGPRRFRLPVTLAKLYLEESTLRAELIHLV